MPNHTYRPLDTERDMDATVRILSLAFGGDDADTRQWLGACTDVARVLVEDGRIRGALALYPMGHWYGGRSVPAWGVAGVGIAPEDRGRGAGTRLMQDAVREMYDAGIALSSLYPAAQPIYRRAGYERAGHLYVVIALLEKIGPIDRSAALRLATTEDEPVLEGLERDRARRHDGNVDRSDLFWKRARAPRGKATEAYVVEEDGVPTGYVRLRQAGPQGKNWLSCTDVVASTRTAARRLLAFLADHASQIEKARWLGHPTDPLQTVADSLCFEVKVGDVWMLRVTHVENALAARGYSPGLTAEAHLEIEDDLCPGNAGRWLLRVEGGAAKVERGGEGRIGLHVRDLAPLYSGYAAPLVLRAATRIEGSDDDLRTLGAIFAGGAPWMQDAF